MKIITIFVKIPFSNSQPKAYGFHPYQQETLLPPPGHYTFCQPVGTDRVIHEKFNTQCDNYVMDALMFKKVCATARFALTMSQPENKEARIAAGLQKSGVRRQIVEPIKGII
jgi:hypothetical protein